MRKAIATIAVSAVLCLSAQAWSADPAEHEHEGAHPELPKKAICVLMPTEGNRTAGVLSLAQHQGFVHISGKVSGLTPGLHGFHIHEFGDLSSPDGTAAGGHFNPTNQPHAGPDDPHRHSGDLGNITAGVDGVANVNVKAIGLMLHFAIGRSMVVHADPDDLKSQPAGNAGPRVAVGVIGVAQSQ